jgi:RNA polymerase sigma-70 factor (ECF subfamily)
MDANTFKSLVLPLNRKLYAFALRFINDTDEAKDIVQEIYIKLWNIRTELDKYNSVEALAMKMTRNLCLDKIKLKKTIPLNPLLQQKMVEENNKETEQEVIIAANRAKKIIEQLDDPQKSILQLHDIQGYDYEEIAEILEMNINTIRVTLSRARKKVKELLINTYYHHEKSGNTISFREIL